tara:strand:+ start:1147 stop:2154 length:1008 start_codon:yes stop_codon:yes gene_type:complete
MTAMPPPVPAKAPPPLPAAKPPRFARYPVWPTVLLMTILAVVGAIAWEFVTFVVNSALVMASGPFAWFSYGPALIVSYGTIGAATLVAVPVWSLIGGSLFAAMACGSNGGAARHMGVTFFSETHPINKVTQKLAERMGLPKIPYVGWFDAEEINAFAMGTSPYNALVAVSTGAVERLTKQELIAVIGHELGHVVCGDMAKMTYARNVQEAFSFFLIFRGLKSFARWVFSPLSELELLRMSRGAEFVADEISARMLGPQGMISALEHLRQDKVRLKSTGYANVSIRSAFMGGTIFSTHPPLEQRIERLRRRLPQKTPDIMPMPLPESARQPHVALD